MRLLIRFVRIYTPFICSLAALVNGALFLQGKACGDVVFIFSTITGNSLAVNAYMFVTSLRMCRWYKANIVCLCLVHLVSIAYNYSSISTSLYLWIVTLLSALGIICFLIFKKCYEVTTAFGCNRKRSRKSERH